jgi:hypothetical protein
LHFGFASVQNAWAQTPETQMCHGFHESRCLTLEKIC